MRINLVTPFAEKDAVKALGAKWDSSRKVWYIVDVSDLTPFQRWLPGDRSVAASATKVTKVAQSIAIDRATVTEVRACFSPCSCDVLPWEDCEHTRIQ